MTVEAWIFIALVVLCLTLSFFFACAETALTVVSRGRILHLARNGGQRARTAARLIEDRERVAGALLLGGRLANIVATVIVAALMFGLMGEIGLLCAALAMTVIVVALSEVLPKTIAARSPERVTLALAPAVRLAVAILGPLAGVAGLLVRGLLKLFGVTVNPDSPVLSAREEIRSSADHHTEGGARKHERDMLGGLLDLSELAVSDVMVHRTNMVSLDADAPPAELVRQVLAAPYTRIPLWRGQPENIVGILHAKDLLRAMQAAGGDASSLNAAGLARAVWFVPDSTSLPDQLRAFLKKKTHFALVVDEYGEVMGIVTLEDIIEEIVGEIADEHDISIQGLRAHADGSVTVDGGTPIRDLNRAMEWDLPDEEATTIAGLVIHEARTIPEPKQAFTFHGFRFLVLRRQRNRITSLRITPLKPTSPAAG
jgi:Mg2+/Co2+ transporter CorB